ncbi:uncharacterized protein FIBRA_04518 [Fibroporia radiculosa]|uniref:Uncharacterized protein n=1 Tax=Fibroporia radiculosa TaxID=599839 RepID=J4GPD8_9APHY|nr:uncharacterized protein FIBRA_04518 [Fibroporia radiculosa]CCM02420.1 predicted protein [Fibroporia radiculosa]
MRRKKGSATPETASDPRTPPFPSPSPSSSPPPSPMLTPRQSSDDAVRSDQSQIPVWPPRSRPPPDPFAAEAALSDDWHPDSPEPSSSHLSPPRSLSSRSPSPFNPNASVRHPRNISPAPFQLVASEESHALAAQPPSLDRGGSMILYRLAHDDAEDKPPILDAHSTPRAQLPADMLLTLSNGSKFPSGPSASGTHRFIPYAFDPGDASKQEPEDDDQFYYLEDNRRCTSFSWRGFINIGTIVLLIGGILTLFVGYPVITFVRGCGFGCATTYANINSTGQTVVHGAHGAFRLTSIVPDTPLGSGLP